LLNVLPTGARRQKANNRSRAPVRDRMIAMLSREEGATLPELMKTFGWLRHTTYGYISNLGSKFHHKIDSTKDN
jgi:hypothetical protein